MKVFVYQTSIASILIAALLPVTAAHAQLGDLIKGGERAGSAIGQGMLGNVGSGSSTQSLTSASLGNVAGLLEFCLVNNHLQGDDALSVKDKLIGKLPGGSSSSDKEYKKGAKGLLTGSDGQQFNLNNLKAEANKQICAKTLAQGKSML